MRIFWWKVGFCWELWLGGVLKVVMARVIWVDRGGWEGEGGERVEVGVTVEGGGAVVVVVAGEVGDVDRVMAETELGFASWDVPPSIELAAFLNVDFDVETWGPSSSQGAVSNASDEGGIGGSERGQPRWVRLTPVLSPLWPSATPISKSCSSSSMSSTSITHSSDRGAVLALAWLVDAILHFKLADDVEVISLAFLSRG